MATRARRSPIDEGVDALVVGQHPDPFSLLGPHVDDDGTPVVRAFHPAAQSIEVRLLTSGTLVPMERRAAAGFFEARLDASRLGTVGRIDPRPDYRLRITFHPQHVLEIDDPYRYGRVLTDFDLHLIGEGTHHRLFDKLGSHR